MLYTRRNLVTDKQQEAEGKGATLTDVANAIGLWASMNWHKEQKPPSVAEAAKAFNTTAVLVKEAIEIHYFAYLSPQGEADPEQQFIVMDKV
jgi:hypothetical protein